MQAAAAVRVAAVCLSEVYTHTDSRKNSTPDELAAVARLLHGWMK